MIDIKTEVKKVTPLEYVQLLRDCDCKIAHDPEYGTDIVIELPHSDTAILISIPYVLDDKEELRISFIDEKED